MSCEVAGFVLIPGLSRAAHGGNGVSTSSCYRRHRPARCEASPPGASRAHLVRWLADEGGCKVHPALDMSRTDEGLRLTADVANGAALLELPAAAVLSSANAEILFGRAADSLSAPAALAAVLLEHRNALQLPEYRPFIEALPTLDELHQPFLWTDAELALLTGSSLRGKALDVRDGIREEWEQVCAALQRSFSLEDYMWAQAIVVSRSFELGKAFPLVLGPGLDLVAHADVGEEPTAAVVGEGGGLFSKPRVLLCTTRDVAAGTRMTMRYVDDGAGVADYVLDYGFIPESGRAETVVEVEFGLAGLDPFYEDKAEIVERAGVGTSNVYRLSSDEPRGAWAPPEGMEQFLRLVCVAATDAFLLEAVFRGEVWDFMALPVSKDNERGMCEAVIAACEDALDGYGGAGGVDEADGAWTGRRAELARAVVDAEKKVLQLARDYYVRELGSLDAKEYYQERRLKALDLLRPLDENEIVDAEAGARMGQAFDERY